MTSIQIEDQAMEQTRVSYMAWKILLRMQETVKARQYNLMIYGDQRQAELNMQIFN